jgi:membrane-bound serine protease (ClpP class)
VAKGLRVQRLQPVTGAELLVGRQGVVRSSLDPEGTVWVAGELWTAVPDDAPLVQGERVEVVAVEGLRLRVRRSSDDGE